jgi:hypothetical protein
VGLEDRHRSGRVLIYTDADALTMWQKLRETIPDDRTHWSVSLMARATGFLPTCTHGYVCHSTLTLQVALDSDTGKAYYTNPS